MQAQVDVKEMQNRLRERKVVLTKQLDFENKKVLPASSAGQDKADLAYDYVYRDRQEARLNRLENQITEVNKALKRIKEGSYGVCTNCGKSINPERLEALPYAEHCINCQRLLSTA